jgi:hypothetical protein
MAGRIDETGKHHAQKGNAPAIAMDKSGDFTRDSCVAKLACPYRGCDAAQHDDDRE